MSNASLLLLSDLPVGAALAHLVEKEDREIPVQLAEGRQALDQFFRSTSEDQLATTRLVGFFTGTIVPRPYLEQLTLEPINFHPAPPSLPGKEPVARAFEDGVTHYGVTAHIMAEKVDTGPIITVSAFDVPSGLNEAALRYRTFLSGYKLFEFLLPYLIKAAPIPTNPELQWG